MAGLLQNQGMNSRVKLNLELYKKIYLIRRSEQAIIENYGHDEMKTPMHMSMGEEAIVAGVCQALREDDQVFGTYRSHGLYLAKTGETDKFFAELYGKASGVVKGKGGSMHLSYPEAGFITTSAVVGSTIPVAIGAAYANKINHNKKVVAVFFGEGALDEGVFWESLNAACLMSLPVVFVCEDNDLAVHTKKSQRQGYKSIDEIVENYNCDRLEASTTNAAEIYKLVSSKLDNVRNKNRPLFLHFYYYRYLEHVGVNEDFIVGYRPKSEFHKWYKKDPLKIQKDQLVKNSILDSEIEKVEKVINSQIARSISLAQKAAFPTSGHLYKDLFHMK